MKITRLFPLLPRIIILQVFVILLLGSGSALAFSGGDGSATNPYRVATAAHLDTVRDNLAAHYLQTANIDLGVAPWSQGEGWVPIGTEATPFTGSYDGGGYEVSGLTINRPTGDYQGLFGYIEGAELASLSMTNFSLTGQNRCGALVGNSTDGSRVVNCSSSGVATAVSRTGGLVGSSQYGAKIEQSHSSAEVTGTGDRIGGLAGQSWSDGDVCLVADSSASGRVTGQGLVGGVIGLVSGSVIRNSHATGAVSGEEYVGGLIGQNYDSSLDACYATGSVSGEEWSIGGLVGVNNGSGEIRNSYATGAVSGNEAVGGLVGTNWNDCEISSSHATGSVTGSSGYVGGFAGENNGSIADSSARGRVESGADSVGGLVGANFSRILRCSAHGDVVADSLPNNSFGVGGLAGYHGTNTDDTSLVPLIENAYATGAVSASLASGAVYAWGGGLVGYSYEGTIRNTYAMGRVQGDATLGGLVGWSSEWCEIVASYWDRTATFQADSDKGEGRSTSEMSYPYAGTTYVGWDFAEVWVEDGAGTLNNGYPVLAEIRLTPGSQGHGPEAASGQSFTVNANVDWTVSRGSDSWITLGTLSGSGDGTVSYSLAVNSSTSARTGTILVSRGLMERTFIVEQAGAGTSSSNLAPEVSVAEATFPGESLLNVTFGSASRFELFDGETGGTWLGDWSYQLVSPNVGQIIQTFDGYGDGDPSKFRWETDLSFTSEHAGTAYRRVFDSDVLVDEYSWAFDFSFDWKVANDYAPTEAEALATLPAVDMLTAIITNPAGFDWLGEKFVFTSSSRFEYRGAEMDESVFGDWTYDLVGPNVGKLTLVYDGYPDWVEETLFTFTSENSGGFVFQEIDNSEVVFETCGHFVLPLTDNLLSVSPTSRNHGSGAASGQTISVSANVSWTASRGSDDWISLGSTSGTNDSTVTYALSGNTSASSRTGTIVFSGGGLTRTFTLEQAGVGGGDPLTQALGLTAENAVTSGGNAEWVVDVGAARSGVVSGDEESWVEAVFEGPGTLTFEWKVSSEEDYDYFDLYVNGELAAFISGESSWQQVSIDLGAGRQTVSWSYSKDDSFSEGSDAGWVRSVDFSQVAVSGLAEPLGLGAENAVTSGGNAGWLVEGGAVRSGSIVDDEQSLVEVYFEGPGTLTFEWKVSSEADYDYLDVYVNNQLVDYISGESSWQQARIDLEAGRQSVRWLYSKDESYSEGSDAGWVRSVVFTRTAGPFLTHPDFNSDGNADLLWRNAADGRVVSWWMDGKTIANYKTVAQVGDPNWQIVGSGNFNDNGRTDLLWKHSDGRVVAWWLNEDASIESINVIAQINNPAWQIAGVGDLDNDGSADIIWQNTTTGIMVAWFMRSDSTVRSTKGFAKMTNPDWNLSGLGDFDQDGRTDLLWVNSATGRLQVWRMDAGEIIGYAQAGVLGDTNWKVVGTGDFNVDGKVDILWRHIDGRVVFWAMDGLSQTSTEVIGQVSNPNWLLF